jgi:RNA polymerase sigma factor (sigma-70 family)
MEVKYLLKELRKCPKYSKQELIELAKVGSAEARKQMVLGMMPFAVDRAKRYQNLGVSITDLISAAFVGLIRGVDKFDYRYKLSPLTYVGYWIKREIICELCSNRTIRVPIYLFSKKTLEDPELVHLVEASVKAMQQMQNIDGDDRLVEDPNTADASDIELIESNEEMAKKLKAVREAMLELGDRSIEILWKRAEGKTLKCIGEELGLTKERIRQIENASIKNLRKKLGIFTDANGMQG